MAVCLESIAELLAKEASRNEYPADFVHFSMNGTSEIQGVVYDPRKYVCTFKLA